MPIAAQFNPLRPGGGSGDYAADTVTRRRLPLSEFAPQDQKLGEAYAYWQSKRRDGLLPSRRDIDILDLRPLMGWTHLVDTTSSTPAEYRYRLVGTAVRIEATQDFKDFRLGDYPSKIYRDSLLEDYGAVVFSGVPSLHHIVAVINYVSYNYTRLILPMADDWRHVDSLMVCVNRRSPKDTPY